MTWNATPSLSLTVNLCLAITGYSLRSHAFSTVPLLCRSFPNLGSFAIIRIGGRRGLPSSYKIVEVLGWSYKAVLSKMILVHTCCHGIITKTAPIHSQKCSSLNDKLCSNQRKGIHGGWNWEELANLRPTNIREKYMWTLRVWEVFMHLQCVNPDVKTAALEHYFTWPEL